MSTGLRRFTAGAGVPAPGAADTELPDTGTAAAGRTAPQRCELCAQPVPAEHGHLVDLSDRALSCACQACYLLFTGSGAGGGRYRAVPRRYRYAAALPISGTTWERLAIPVGMAFFFYNSTLERTVALYPSPAGATECELDLGAWAELVEAAPQLTELAPDVEALLVDRTDAEVGCAGYLVPIDACYHLVGLVRTHWRGFAGGDAAWQAIGEFLAGLRERSEPARLAGGG